MDKFIDNLFSETLYNDELSNEVSHNNKIKNTNINSFDSLSKKYINKLNNIAKKRNAKILTIHDFNKLTQNGGSLKNYSGFCHQHPTQCGVGGYGKTPACGMTGGGDMNLEQFTRKFNKTSNYKTSKNVINNLYLLINNELNKK